MQKRIPSYSRHLVITLCIAAAAGLNPGCSSLTPQQRGALLVGAEGLVQIAANAVGAYAGGSQRNQLASAGLSALASVLQGYVGSTVPRQIVTATPGVPDLGQSIAPVISSSRPVTQADVNSVQQAAKLAASAGN